MTARVGLVLGAGGLTGEAFHTGALAGLADVTGWDPRTAQIVVGTSAGSIVGTYLRLGIAPEDLVGHLCDGPVSPSASRLFDRMGPEVAFLPDGPRTWPRPPSPALLSAVARGRAMPSAVLAAVLPAGRVPTDPWAQRIRRMTGPGWPRDGLWICVVRQRDGRRIVFGRDGAPTTDIANAVAASCAIPTFFRPVEIGAELYVDGGAHSPTNADVLRHEPLDLVVALAPMSTSRRVVHLHPDHGVRWGYRYQLAREAGRLRRAGLPVIAFQPDAGDLAVMRGNPMDRDKVRPVVQRVRASVAERLRTGGHAELLAALAA